MSTNIKLNEGEALVLRTCNVDLTAYKGFKWPESGVVEAPDWDPKPECGYGLHGLLWGEGDGSLLNWSPDAKWLVCKVVASECVELRGKVKFPRCEVVFCGDRLGATKLIQAHRPGAAVTGGTATAGNHGTATAGDSGTATAGNHGTATAGNHGTATAGYKGTATAGNHGTATAGDSGTATAGNHGTATAGNHGTATAGYKGTATAGNHGTATAGEFGIIELRFWDGRRWRKKIGYIGEDGLLPNTKYRLNDAQQFEAVK
jgi:hypothetical protein